MDLSKIKELRKSKGFKQSELANMAFTCQTHISMIENNKVRPSLELLERIAKVLGYEVEISFKLKIK